MAMPKTPIAEAGVLSFPAVKPFEPVLAEVPPQGPEWIAQIKWDGVRMLACRDGNGAELVNRRGNRRTAQYPELADIAAYCRADSVILDGEIIAMSGGKPSFHEVMRRDGARTEASIRSASRQVQVIYMVFDILYRGGVWLTDRPLAERQKILQETLRPHPHVQAVPSYPDGAGLLEAARSQSLEGIVCKDLGSRYAPGGKDARWRKIKLLSDVTAVAGGVTFRDGIVNALLLGLYDEAGRLHYIGDAGSGRLTAADWRELTALAHSMAADRMPFASPPARAKGKAMWVRPELVFKLHFLEWNASGTMRQPVIQCRMELPPSACTLDQRPGPAGPLV
ncbi:ATP-dependent DNA ligase [Paenibacillus spiritus]|uniref:ATP-dependent DNA ligase n=1 Tax=Paenibacillus spiritus TaxID=2496557 RepID=UPI001CC3FA31|nr:DNA ligase [Paenibacillus spiritus]